MLKEGHSKYLPKWEDFARTLEMEIERLKDPQFVHINMLRGTIAWTPEHLRHILGDSLPNAEPTDR